MTRKSIRLELIIHGSPLTIYFKTKVVDVIICIIWSYFNTLRFVLIDINGKLEGEDGLQSVLKQDLVFFS